MTFEIGDKVQTNTGLYVGGTWREAGFKGEVIRPENAMGLVTVKFKGVEDIRFLRPEYLTLRKKAKRPFKTGDTVSLTEDVAILGGAFPAGTDAEVTAVIPYSNLVEIELLFTGAPLTVAEEILSKTEVVVDSESEEGEAVPDLFEVKDNPEVQEALGLILDRIEEIKTLLTTKPQTEFHIYTSEASFVTPKEEEPEPEPVFKKAKEVNEGDLLYTEGGAWDKVNRVETKDSGYTSLYGVFGNKIAQVPSGRVVQVLEPVS